LDILIKEKSRGSYIENEVEEFDMFLTKIIF